MRSTTALAVSSLAVFASLHLWAGPHVFEQLLKSGKGVSLATALRPIVNLLSLPLIVLTLGLMLLVVNALMLLLTSSIADSVGLGFHVDGFWVALFGSIVISVASMILEAIFPDHDRR